MADISLVELVEIFQDKRENKMVEFILTYWELIALAFAIVASIFVTIKVKVPHLTKKVNGLGDKMVELEKQLDLISKECQNRGNVCQILFQKMDETAKQMAAASTVKMEDLKRCFSQFEMRITANLTEFDAKRDATRRDLEYEMNEVKIKLATLSTRMQNVSQQDFLEKLAQMIKDSVQEAITPSAE